MARLTTILLLTLFAAMPMASALPLQADAPATAPAQAAPTPQSLPAPAALADTLQAAPDLTRCRLAVPVALTWYSGQGADERQARAEWLLPKTWTWTTAETVLRNLPVDVATSSVDGLAGALPVAVPPTGGLVAQTVETLHQASGDVLVEASWTETYVTWTRHEEAWLVNPAGVVLSEGLRVEATVLVCDPGATVLDTVPAAPRGPWTCICLLHPPEDGWVVPLVSADARVAQAGDDARAGLLDMWAGANAAVLLEARKAFDGLPLDLDALARQAGLDNVPGTDAEEADADAGPATATSGHPSLVATGGAGLAGLAACLAACVAMRIRRKP